MPTWIFTAPVFEDDEEKTRIARLLNAALIVLLVTTVLGSAVMIVLEPTELAFNLIFGIVLTAAILALRFSLHRGHVQIIGMLLSLLLWASITLLLFTSGGIGNPSIFGYFLLIGITGLLLGERPAFLFGFLTSLAVLALYYAEVNDLIAVRVRASTAPTELVMLIVGLVLASLMVRFVVHTIAQGLERARRNERALAERNRELEAGQRITLAASQRVNPDELLSLVVNLIRDQFALYHVQVYIVDEAQGAAVLRKSTGYAGRQLLQNKHKIPLDHPALVTKAIQEGRPVLVTDVSQEPSFMPNPLLADTKSELVVPLKIGERVIGALDAQDRTVGRFNENTVNLFQTMAGQIAFLFENSELLERVSEQTQALTGFTSQLRTAADIAERLSAILDLERLLQQAAELMQSHFGLYHAHIYVLDKKSRQLIVRAGSGEVGRVLRERGHSVSLDAENSPVARAARKREITLIHDTSLEPDFVPTPLLPQTRSEAAVPLIAGDKILGVLDVQDDQPDRFTLADLDTFSTLAGQIATALQNADLFGQVEENLQQTQVRLRVSQALVSAQTEEEVLDVIIQQADLYPQTQVAIFTLDQETKELTAIARRSESFENGPASAVQPGTFVSLSRTMHSPAPQFQLMHHVKPDTPFISADLPLDERADPATRELARQMGTVSLAILPMMVGNELLGSIAVSSTEKGYLDEQKLQLYSTLAEQGATALRAARLSDDVHRSEERLRSILETSPIPMIVSRMTEGVVVYGNKILGEMFGIPYEDLIVNKTPDFYHDPADRQTVLQALQNNGYLDQKELRLKKADGTTFWALLSMRITTFDGEPAVISVIYDITERKRAEEEQVRLTDQLHTAADLAEQINAILDPDQLLHEVTTQLQSRFDLYHVHVYLLDEETHDLVMRAGSGAVGRTLREQGHKISLDRKQSLVACAARNREVVSVGDTNVEPDFMPNPLLPQTRSEVAIPLITGDKVLGVLDVQDSQPHRFRSTDLNVFSTLAGQIATALQNAAFVDDIQQTAERLRGVDRLRSELLANLNYELRTPLNSILGYAELMLANTNNKMDPDAVNYVRAIHNSGQHLLNVINDALDLAKIEAGRLTLDFKEIEIKSLLDDVGDSTAELLVNPTVELVFEIEENIPSIQGDRVRLLQALNNITFNAAKFADEGPITLRAYHLPSRLSPPGSENGWVCIEVNGTGTDIKAEDLEDALENFRRADPYGVHSASKTSLGLIITHHLVKMHGGKIKVDNQPGQRSTFTVHLPVGRRLTEATTRTENG